MILILEELNPLCYKMKESDWIEIKIKFEEDYIDNECDHVIETREEKKTHTSYSLSSMQLNTLDELVFIDWKKWLKKCDYEKLATYLSTFKHCSESFSHSNVLELSEDLSISYLIHN